MKQNDASAERRYSKKAESCGHEAESIDWVEMYTISRNILGWSDEEFWRATPRKYFAVLQQYSKLKGFLNNQKQDVLVGKDALSALSQMSSYMR